MKIKTHLLLLFVLFFARIDASLSQWQPVNSGTTSNIVDICFPSDSIGYAVTNNGIVIKTTDEGNNWNVIAALSGTFTSICNVGHDTIFVGGNKIFRSDNAGSTWNNLINLPNTISDLQFFNSREGIYINPGAWMCTWGGGTVSFPDYEVFQTSNFGASWQNKFGKLDPTSRFQLINDSTAYVTGSNAAIVYHCGGSSYNFGMKTTNKGNNWASAPAPGIWYSSFYFVNDTLGYFIGGGTYGAGVLFRMVGTQINMVRQNVSSYNFVFVNKIDGFLIQSPNTISKTRTEGIVWDLDYTSADTLNKLLNDHNKQMFAIGRNGTILKCKITEDLFPDSVYRISSNASALNFDSVTVGGNKEDQVRIANTGNMPLSVSINASATFQVSLPDSVYSNSISFVLPPTRDTLLNVKFLPTDTLHYYDTLVVSGTNVSDIRIPLVGKGISDLKGFLSGIVTLCRDTVKVVGDFTINADGKLIVCPGTTFLFLGHYKFNVIGTLIAQGLQNDSIRFIPQDTVTGWNGLLFASTTSSDTSLLKYCLIKHSNRVGWNNNGGGISIYKHSNLLIDSCTVAFNHDDYYGGGIYIDYSAPTIKNCKIFNNTAQSGGGVYMIGNLPPLIYNNSIFNNVASPYDGGGIMCYANDSANIIQNLIFNNTAKRIGGGISCKQGSHPNIINNTVCNNLAMNDAGGIFCYGNGVYSLPHLLNTVFYFNSPNQLVYSWQPAPIANYCDIQGGYSNGTGIINVNPEFVDPTDSVGFMHQIGQFDWSLKPNSLCINAGDTAFNSFIPLKDFAGNSRIYQSRIDIGAYEYQSMVSVNEFNNNTSISLFPNPFTEVLNIFVSGNNEPLEFILYDLFSRKMIHQKIIQVGLINTKELANGLYIYELRNKNGVIRKGKVVKS